MYSIVASIIGIVISGGTGGFVAVSCVRWLEMTGTTGALVASLIGTLIATIVFATGLVVLRRWGYIK